MNKKKSIEKHPHDQQLNKFADQFAKESDRAKVILSASMLETALDNLIRARLVPTPSSEDSLLDGAYAPLSSFSAKIDMANRLGLVSTKFARDLHLIRRIRNEFAHDIESCDFGDTAIHNRCMELARSSALGKRDPDLRESYEQGPRGDFLLTVAWMLYHLFDFLEEIKPLEAAAPEFGYV